MELIQQVRRNVSISLIVFVFCACQHQPIVNNIETYITNKNSEALKLLLTDTDISELGISHATSILKQGNDTVLLPDSVTRMDAAWYWTVAHFIQPKVALDIRHTIYVFEPNTPNLVNLDTVPLPRILEEASRYYESEEFLNHGDRSQIKFDVWIPPGVPNRQVCDLYEETKICQIRFQYKNVISTLDIMYPQSQETEVIPVVSTILRTIDERVADFLEK